MPEQFVDATALPHAIRKGELTPAEAVEDAIARAGKVNPELNFIAQPLYERARAKATQPPGCTPPEDWRPLAGPARTTDPAEISAKALSVWPAISASAVPPRLRQPSG